MAKHPSIPLRLLAWSGGIILLIAIALWVMTLIARHRLEARRAELEAKGEKFTIAALAPPPPTANASSAAAVLVTACKDLSDKTSSKSAKIFAIGRYESVPSRAEVVHSRKMAIQAKKDVPWEQFVANLEPFRPTLTQIRDATRITPLSLQFDYSKGNSMPMPFLTLGLRAGQYLGMESTLFLREQRPDLAVDNAVAILRIAGVMQEHPLMISQLCANVMMGFGSVVTWEILQSPASSNDLARLQTAWEAISLPSKLPDILRMERAWGCESFRLPFQTLAALTAGLEGPIAAPTRLPESLSEAWQMSQFAAWFGLYRYSDEEQFIASQQKLIDSLTADADLQTLLTSASTIASDVQARGATRLWSSVATSSTVNFLKRLASSNSIQKLTVTAIAIQRYRLDHSGHPPESLEALVPAYLSSVPTDAMDRKPLHYRRAGESFELYSVGLNGADDGGSTISLPGVSAKDIQDRLDIVWPQPAP